MKVRPKAREERVERRNEDRFIVAVKEPPSGGRANAAVLEALARYFGVPRSRLTIVSGATSHQKIIAIGDFKN